MNIEKKGIILGAIWGLISIKFATLGYIFLPAEIVSVLGMLIFGNFPRELLIIAYLFYIIGTILVGAFLGYLIAKIIKRLKKTKQ